jgi:hypothetical protein
LDLRVLAAAMSTGLLAAARAVEESTYSDDEFETLQHAAATAAKVPMPAGGLAAAARALDADASSYDGATKAPRRLSASQASSSKEQPSADGLSALMNAAADVRTSEADAAAVLRAAAASAQEEAEIRLQASAKAADAESKAALKYAVAAIDAETAAALSSAKAEVAREDAAAGTAADKLAKPHRSRQHHHQSSSTSSAQHKSAAPSAAAAQEAQRQRTRAAVMARRARRKPHVDLSQYDRAGQGELQSDKLPSLQRCILRSDAHAVAALLSQAEVRPFIMVALTESLCQS